MSIVYTPVRLQIISPILDADTGAALDDRHYLIKIKCPQLYNLSNQQALPTTIVKELQIGQQLTLLLLPSDQTIPRGKYTVTYAYKSKPQQILETEEWVVPIPPIPSRSLLSLVPETLTYDLPFDFYTLVDLQVGPEGTPIPPYKIYNHQIIFDFPPILQTVYLDYTRVMMRADIVYLPSTWRATPVSKPNSNFEYLSSY